jgi:hypothetical protein
MASIIMLRLTENEILFSGCWRRTRFVVMSSQTNFLVVVRVNCQLELIERVEQIGVKSVAIIVYN